MTFEVIDPKTGEYPDLEHIVRTEEWAQNLSPLDMNMFCIDEDGNLLLMDECGNYAYCPPDRFKVTFDFPVYSREVLDVKMQNLWNGVSTSKREALHMP